VDFCAAVFAGPVTLIHTTTDINLTFEQWPMFTGDVGNACAVN